MEHEPPSGRHVVSVGNGDGLAPIGASAYKHMVLGPIFLKDVDDAVDERRAVLRDEPAADRSPATRPRSSSSPATSSSAS